jgi:murein L,D-transpeptidase YafK
MVLLAWPAVFYAAPAGTEQPIDRILIVKHERKMMLYRAGQPVRTYDVSLGAQPEGAKTRRGDNRTPEGKYRIVLRNPNSKFHLSLKVSYPNAEDKKRAKELGVDPGGDIMIHGLPNGMGWLGSTHLLNDWTQGCIAVTSEEIEEIWSLTPVGAPVEILP